MADAARSQGKDDEPSDKSNSAANEREIDPNRFAVWPTFPVGTRASRTPVPTPVSVILLVLALTGVAVAALAVILVLMG